MACTPAAASHHAAMVLKEAERKLKMLESAERMRSRFAEEAAKKAARHTVALGAVVPRTPAKSRRGGKNFVRNALMVKSRTFKRVSGPEKTVEK